MYFATGLSQFWLVQKSFSPYKYSILLNSSVHFFVNKWFLE